MTRHHRPTAMLFVAAAATLAGCTGSPGPTDGGDPAAPASRNPGLAATASPSPSAEETLAAAPSRIKWAEVPFDGEILDVVGDGSRFVAVGAGVSGTASWVSSDGLAWEEVNVPEQVHEIGLGQQLVSGMGHLVRLGDTLFSFGGLSFMDAFLGAGWRWTDGDSWQVIESSSDFFRTRVNAVTASDDALLAAGVLSGGPRGNWVTWRWTSSTSWERTPLSETGDEVIAVTSVAWGAGTFLAAGFSGPVDGASLPQTRSIWISPDGMAWTPVAVPEDVSHICAVSATPAGGFVALGRAGDRVAAWKSADGADWEEAEVEPQMSGQISEQSTCAVVATDGGFLALVSNGAATFIWSSTDADGWIASDGLDVRLEHAAVVGDQVVVIARGPSMSGERVVMRGRIDH